MSEPLENVRGPIPGKRSTELLARLRLHESRNVTAIEEHFPVVWESALGSIVTDVDGNEFLDLTSAFGVAAIGHSNPYVASAVADQVVRLAHSMGDVHPSEVRIELLERIASIVPKGLSRTYLATSGSEAIEVALKTAMLATGKSGHASFRNGYHGLSLGALEVTGIERFRKPFAGTLSGNALALAAVRATLGSYLTESDFERTTALATRWAEGVQKIAAQAGLEWSVSQLGCRAEHWPGASLRTGADAAMNNDEELDRYLHLFALNRGVLITPFHNMVLMSPATEESDVDRHLDILREALSELGGTGR